MTAFSEGPRRVLPLSQLQPGQKAEVTSLEGDDLLVQRLLEMGLLEGSRVEFVRRAPMGDPIEIRINGRYNLSIRRADAEHITVKPL